MTRHTIAELQQMPVMPYHLVRPQLRTGDVVFAAGRYVFSRLIAHATQQPITHAGIVVVAEEVDRVLLLEAVENFGVRLAPLSRLVWGTRSEVYRGMVFVARAGDVTLDGVRGASRWGFDELAKPYGYAKIAALAWRIATGVRRKRSRQGYICSEFAAHWLHHAGLHVNPAGSLGYITPGELWAHPGVTLIGRVL